MPDPLFGDLKIVGILNSGETLVIDSALMTVKVVDTKGDTLRNGLPLVSELNFPSLNVGANTVTVAVTGNSVTFTELQISARSRWR